MTASRHRTHTALSPAAPPLATPGQSEEAPARPLPPTPLRSGRPLGELAEESLRRYFDSLNGHAPVDFYRFFMNEVEQPLFRTVMDFTQGNQSRAAEILGINRGTLRKKLKMYGLIY